MTGVRGLGGYVALSRADQWDVLRAFAWLALVDLALHTVGFQHLLRRARVRVAPQTQHTHGRAHRCAHWIDVAAQHYVVPAHCLKRSLALHHWLRFEGLPSELRIGVRKERDELKAHAWVELDGCVVNDRPDAVAAFTPLASPGERLAASSAPLRMVRAWE